MHVGISGVEVGWMWGRGGGRVEVWSGGGGVAVSHLNVL